MRGLVVFRVAVLAAFSFIAEREASLAFERLEDVTGLYWAAFGIVAVLLALAPLERGATG